MTTGGMMPDIQKLSDSLIRLEGKVDAYMAGQNARLDEHERRLDKHDDELRELRSDRAASASSGWKIAGVVVAGLAMLGALVGTLITLIQAVNV